MVGTDHAAQELRWGDKAVEFIDPGAAPDANGLTLTSDGISLVVSPRSKEGGMA